MGCSLACACVRTSQTSNNALVDGAMSDTGEDIWKYSVDEMLSYILSYILSGVFPFICCQVNNAT